MFNFNDFIEESYLDSSKAPLYHYTNIYTFYKILNDNKLDISFFENPFLGKNIFTNILPILKENKIKILKDGKEYKL